MSLNILPEISYPIFFVPERCVPTLGEGGMGYVDHTSILDVVQVSGGVSKDWVIGLPRVVRRAPWETQVSAK